MVAGLERLADGFYAGDFLVLRQTGDRLVGYGGAFYSEWYQVKGRIDGTEVRLRTRPAYGGGDWVSTELGWSPEDGVVEGYEKVSRSALRRYSGGGLPFEDEACS